MQKFILFIITGFIETLTICASLNKQDVQEWYIDKVNILLDNFDFIQTLNTQKTRYYSGRLKIILMDTQIQFYVIYGRPCFYPTWKGLTNMLLYLNWIFYHETPEL